MGGIAAAKVEDFSVAPGSCALVVTTVLAQKTLHQPGFGEVGRDVENSIEKDLSDLPTFLGNCSSRVSSIDSDDRVFGMESTLTRFAGSCRS
jgi:hypothetical protein